MRTRSLKAHVQISKYKAVNAREETHTRIYEIKIQHQNQQLMVTPYISAHTIHTQQQQQQQKINKKHRLK